MIKMYLYGFLVHFIVASAQFLQGTVCILPVNHYDIGTTSGRNHLSKIFQHYTRQWQKQRPRHRPQPVAVDPLRKSSRSCQAFAECEQRWVFPSHPQRQTWRVKLIQFGFNWIVQILLHTFQEKHFNLNMAVQETTTENVKVSRRSPACSCLLQAYTHLPQSARVSTKTGHILISTLRAVSTHINRFNRTKLF